MYALALLCLCQQPRITIYHDTNFESKVLVSELSRDWLACGDRPQLAEMSRKQIFLSRTVRLVTRKGERRLDRIYDGYPFIQYATNGELEQIDRRAFTASGCCLDTVFALATNATTDFAPWKNRCESIVRDSEDQHYTHARYWLRHNLPEELTAHGDCHYEWGLADNTAFNALQDRFSAYDGFPVYVLPVLPKKPVLAMPWE